MSAWWWPFDESSNERENEDSNEECERDDVDVDNVEVEVEEAVKSRPKAKDKILKQRCGRGTKRENVKPTRRKTAKALRPRKVK